MKNVTLQIVAVACSALASTAFAQQPFYEQLKQRLEESPFGIPLLVEASVEDRLVQGDVYSVLDHPFERVSRAVTEPAAWCQMLTLHFNVKSCRVDASLSAGERGVPLRIETARKYYVPPQGRTSKTYWLDASDSKPGLLRASLIADRGPFGVRDMRIEVFGVPVDDTRSFVHLRYSYAPGFFARAATSTFLATLGRRKVGFTVTGTDRAGEPVYVKGAQGAVERNALRYHLALVAYLDTAGGPADPASFESRIARWFELTEQHPRQLREMSREAYLTMKRRERADQDVVARPVSLAR